VKTRRVVAHSSFSQTWSEWEFIFVWWFCRV